MKQLRILEAHELGHGILIEMDAGFISPQNEINEDIISQLGYFNIGNYIGDPRQVSSSSTTYPDLVKLSENFFQKYFASYDLFDYIFVLMHDLLKK